MFHCYLHGWSSHESMCPVCSSNMSFSSNSVNLNIPTQTEEFVVTEEEIKSLEKRVEAIKKENEDVSEQLTTALLLLDEAYVNFNIYNPTGSSKAGKTLKKIKEFLSSKLKG